MNIYTKSINIISFTFLLAFSSGILNAEQVDIPEPEMLQESYLQGTRDAKREQCSKEVASALGRECSFCHNEDVTDLTEKGEKAKVDMKAATAMGVKCDYCHVGIEQFTDKIEVAAKMFRLTEMMDVECSFCHAGKDVLTQNGITAKTAMILQDWTGTGNNVCLKCHDKKKQFKLNAHGVKIHKSQKDLLGR